MASSRTAEFLFMFNSILIGLLVAYGQSTPTFTQYIGGPLSTLTAPFQDFNSLLAAQGYTGLKNCSFLDANCNSQNISQATIFVGTSLIWLGGTIFGILNRIGAGIFLIFGLTQFLTNDLGVPFLGYIFTAWLIMSILYGLSLIRGTSTGV